MNNVYFILIHTFTTRPPEMGDTCGVTFDYNLKLSIEILLFIPSLLLPFLIAKGIKFLFENKSFHVLEAWNELLQEICPKASKYALTKTEWNIRYSFYWTLFWFAIALVVAGLGSFKLCPPEKVWHRWLFFLGEICSISSSLVAIVGSFNICRMYTIFIQTRTAVFQAQLKQHLIKFVSKHGLLLYNSQQIIIESFEHPIYLSIFSNRTKNWKKRRRRQPKTN